MKSMTHEELQLFETACAVRDTSERLRLFRSLALRLPENPDVQQQIARCHAELGDLQEATRILRASLDAIDDGWTRLYLGNMCWRHSDLDGAEEQFELAAALLPETSVPIWSLGDIKRARGQIDDAEALYRRAIKAEPDSAEAHSLLGRVLLENGDLVDGKAHVFTALELDPSCALARRIVAVHRLGLPRRTAPVPATSPMNGMSGDEWQCRRDRLKRKAQWLRSLIAEGDVPVLDKDRYDDPRWLERKAAEAAARVRRKAIAVEHKAKQRRRRGQSSAERP